MIVGITGKKRSGKDTMATSFEVRGYRKVSFANPIRHFVENIIGEDITDANKEQEIPWLGNGISPRKLMQTIGTEWGRSIHPDLWVLALIRSIDEAIKLSAQHLPSRFWGSRADFVIPDVRFENEAKAIRDRGGVIIHVHRSGLPDDAHVSERGIEQLPDDIVVGNVGSLVDYGLLCEQIYGLVVERSRNPAP